MVGSNIFDYIFYSVGKSGKKGKKTSFSPNYKILRKKKET